MCDAQCADEYCVRIYSEAKMKHKARVSRFLFVSNLFPSIFSLNTNLGFLAFQSSKKTNENLQKKTVVLCDDDDDIDDDDDAEKRGRALLRVTLLIFFDDDKKKNEEP